MFSMSMSVSHLNTLGGKTWQESKKSRKLAFTFWGRELLSENWPRKTCVQYFVVGVSNTSDMYSSFLTFFSSLPESFIEGTKQKKKSPIFCSFSIMDTHELTLCKVHCMFPITFTVFENFLYFHLRPLNDFSLGQNYLKIPLCHASQCMKIKQKISFYNIASEVSNVNFSFKSKKFELFVC